MNRVFNALIAVGFFTAISWGQTTSPNQIDSTDTVDTIQQDTVPSIEIVPKDSTQKSMTIPATTSPSADTMQTDSGGANKTIPQDTGLSAVDSLADTPPMGKMHPPDTAVNDTAGSPSSALQTSDSANSNDTNTAVSPIDTNLHLPDLPNILDDDKNRQYQFVLPLEGDVVYEPYLQVIIGLGKDAYSSVSFLLDGRPIPVAAVTSKNLLTIDIKNLTHGLHRLRVTFLDDSLKILAKKEVTFFVRLPEPDRTQSKGRLRQSGTVFLKSEFRGTSVINQVKGYKPFKNNAKAVEVGKLDEELFPKSDHILHSSYRLKYKLLELQTRLSINSRENPYRQASHRYGGRLNVGPWLSAKGGDVYPFMNDLILRDTRIRGGESKLALVLNNIEWASLEIAHGEIRRETVPHVLVYKTDGQTSHDTIPGAYARSLTAARLGFGARSQLFSLGITVLKTKDKKHRWDELIHDSIPHYAPEQNLVTGIDFQLGFWDHRILLFSDAAYSLWTANTNAAILGSSDSRINFDVSGLDPGDFKSLIVLNSSTKFHPNHPLKNMGLQFGTRIGIPFPNLATESEVFYYNTGEYYRSEGNPFLSTTGEKGLRLIQRFNLLENRLSVGAEGGYATRSIYSLDTASNHLVILSYKGDIRYAPQANLPSLWLGVNGVESDPAEKKAVSPVGGFVNRTLYMGGYHHILLGPGKLYAGLSYSLTANQNRLYASVLDKTSNDTSFSTKTNIFFTTLQYRRSNSPLIPFLRYSITSNGVRKPINDVTIGSNLAFSRRLSGSISFQVGEHPVKNKENDLKFGEQVSINYILAKQHSIYIHEKFYRNGQETDYNIGASYELLF